MNVAYIHGGILFSLKQKGDSIRGTIKMNPEDIVLSETDPSQKDKYCMIPLG